MLSPASHRVCCLAVMAPALTKGDSRTDCLPVELSGPYCISAKASTIREDNKYLNGFRASRIAHLLKNRQLMNRAGVPKDNRSAEVHEQRKSLLSNGKFRLNADVFKSKLWHAPSATLAVAGKVKSKYSMIKANGSNKSMGLVRGNTALALQSIKTMNSKRNNSSNKTCETQAPSPDLPDTTNSELELNTQIPSLRTVHPTLEPSNEEVSSSCGDLLPVCPDPVLDSFSKSVQNENCTLVSLQDGTSVSPREDNLIVSTVNEDLSYKNFIKEILSKPNDCSPLVEGGTVPHNGNDNVAEDEVDSPPTNCTNSESVLIPSSNVNNSLHATSGDQAQLPPPEVEDIPSIMTASSPLAWQADVDLKSPVISADYSDSECAPDDIIPSSPLSQSDIETASASCSMSSSSTLSANNSNSPAHSFEEDTPAPVRLTFPDEFLGTVLPSADRGTLPAVDSIELCCPLETQDILSLSEKLRQQELRLEEGLRQTEELMRQQMMPHVQLQLAAVTAMLRHEGGFHCQRPAKSSIVHRDRGLKDPSMAALIDFVRRVETCPPPRQIVGAEVSEPTLSWVTGDSKDLALTRHSLERRVRALLVTVDPDLTEESSEEESSDVEEPLESSGSRHPHALWTYLCERASLTRRSTWLLARIHELENQMRSLRRHSSTPLQLGPGGSCRLRPLLTPRYRRPILSTLGVHHEEGNSRLARLSSLPCSCSCADDRLPCVLCTGRYNCAMGVDPDATTLRDRVALLAPDYHPLLSEDQDVPLLLHFESIFKKNEDQYQKVRPVSPSNSARESGNKEHYPSSSQRKFTRYSRSYFTSKYRNNNKKHFRKHKLVFGKWRKLQNKSSFHSRRRFRRLSIPSSDSSIEDSPLSSPMSPSEDGFLYDGRRRRDDSQFDIDDVIIPFGSKGGRVQKYEVKDIEIPSWRQIDMETYEFSDCEEFSTNPTGCLETWKTLKIGESQSFWKSQEEEEDMSDSTYEKRHASYEAEERKIVRSGGDTLRFFNTWEKRTAQIAAAKKGQTVPEFLNNHKTLFPDRAADEEAANPLEDFAEEVGKICEEELQEDLLEPILPPPEDSLEPSRSTKRPRQDGDPPSEAEEDAKRPRLDEAEEDPTTKQPDIEDPTNKQLDIEDPIEKIQDVLPPYEPLSFPLSDEVYQQLLAETNYGGDLDLVSSVLFDPPPVSPTAEAMGEEEYCGGSTTTTVEEDIEGFEEEDDPEWVVVNKDSGGGEQAPLVLKFAKR